jgi:6-pyruvoyl-tetrahydropterin synthase
VKVKTVINFEPKNFTSSNVRTIFIEDIDRIDCAIFSPSQGIMGQSWHVDVFLSGSVDENGFIHDFSHLRKLVKNVLRSSIDHALLIPIMSKQVAFKETDKGEHWDLKAFSRLTNYEAQWEYTCPKGAVYPIRSVNISKSIVEQECSRLIRHRLPTQVEKVSVKLREEIAESQATFFRYTHGITNHDGLCQRLFHGHRSLIGIHIDGERREDLEQFVAHELLGSSVHVASVSQIESGHVEAGKRGSGLEPISISYEGQGGHYRAKIPARNLFVVQGETSIETIAYQLVKDLKERMDISSKIQVLCCEGIGKGALAEL